MCRTAQILLRLYTAYFAYLFVHSFYIFFCRAKVFKGLMQQSGWDVELYMFYPSIHCIMTLWLKHGLLPLRYSS